MNPVKFSAARDTFKGDTPSPLERTVMRGLLYSVVFLAALSLACVVCKSRGVADCCSPPVSCCGCGLDPSPCVRSYVEIRGKDGGAGSGVCVGPRRVLTCCHVVEACGEFDVVKMSDVGGIKTTYAARVVASDSERDLALVETEEAHGLPVATLLDGEVKLGETCVYVGTPFGLHASLDRSVINKVAWKVGGQAYTLTNGSATYGNSGGPMYVVRDGKWKLAGVAVRLERVRNPRSPVCFATAGDIGRFLKGAK